MEQRSMDGTTSVVDNGGLGLQDPPWVNTQLPPLGDHDTSLSHSLVLLTSTNAGDFLDVTARHGRSMMICLLAVPPPFVTIPLATKTSFLPDSGYLDSKHNATVLPDRRAHPDTVGATAARVHPDTVRDVAQWQISACRPFCTTRSSWSLVLCPHRVMTMLHCISNTYSAKVCR